MKSERDGRRNRKKKRRKERRREWSRMEGSQRKMDGGDKENWRKRWKEGRIDERQDPGTEGQQAGKGENKRTEAGIRSD